MIAEPKSFKCTIHIQKMEADPEVPEKFLLSGEIIAADEQAKNNTFFSAGRAINGYTFNPPAEMQEGKNVTADVEFMGDPFVQNYHLRNVEPEG